MAFHSIEDAAAWAEQNGGEEGLRVALADGRFGNNLHTIAFATVWLQQQEEQRAQSKQIAALDATLRSAEAAEKAAKWTFWAAIAAAVGAFASLLQALAPLVKT